MKGIRSNWLTLVFQLAYPMSRRSRFSAVLHRTWHRKSWGRSSFVALLQTSMLLEFSCLPFSVANFPIKAKTTRSYIPRSWQENLEFLIMFLLGQEVSFLNVCKLMPMIGQLQAICGRTHGCRISIQRLTNHWYRIQAVNRTPPEEIAIMSKQLVLDMVRPIPTHFTVLILAAVILQIDQMVRLINNILEVAMNHVAHRVKTHKQ